MSGLKLLIQEHFPSKPFLPQVRKRAGKILANQGEEAARKFLEEAQYPGDVTPPAKCLILAKSRDFGLWPIQQFSAKVQGYIYGLAKQDFDSLDISTKGEDHKRWLKERGLGDLPYPGVQAANLIFKHAVKRYQGVLKKVENRNKKIQEKNKIREERGEPLESLVQAFNENGYLLQPPGINPSVYICQQFSPFAVQTLEGLPAEYQGCKVAPNDEIRSRLVNRLDIPKGAPGYVPEHQRVFLNRAKNRRRRCWYSTANTRHDKAPRPLAEEARIEGALLVKIQIREDWVLLDARGLLRNVRWRRLAPEQLTLKTLLGMFSGDPVIDTRRGLVTFSYKEGGVPILKRRIVGTRKTKGFLEGLTQQAPVALVSVDLGQNKFLSAKVSVVGADLVPRNTLRFLLPEPLTQAFRALREGADKLEEDLKDLATASLPVGMQEEVKAQRTEQPQEVGRALCRRYGLDPATIPWAEMRGHTEFLSDILEAKGCLEATQFTTPKGVKRKTDGKFAGEFKTKLSSGTRVALQDALWELKRTDTRYQKLALRKLELARRCANWVVRNAKDSTHCSQVVLNIENLSMASSFFHGKGKREKGWDSLFRAKRENRWFIQVLHKALSDLAPHQGIPVLEINPARTSITCPRCAHCDRLNRDGELFVCLKCGVRLDADLEVATDNIERVALTGLPMPKSERLGGNKIAVGARGRKTPDTRDKTEVGGTASSASGVSNGVPFADPSVSL